MKTYKPEEKRVVGFFGHRGSGKTSLVEACLFDAKATTRLGSVEQGTLHLESDPEALERLMTVQTNVGFVEWEGVWVGMIDTPGDANFWGNTARAFRAVDAAVLCVSGVDGLEPQTFRCVEVFREQKIPFAVFVTKVDKEAQTYDDVIAEIKQELSANAAVLALPIGLGPDFSGVAALLSGKAFLKDGAVGDVPGDMAGAVDAAREQLVDAVAASDDALMEKYLEEGSLGEDELATGLKAGFLKGEVLPVFVGAPTLDVGARPLLNFIKAAFPTPLERPVLKGTKNLREDAPLERRPGEGALVAQVFRTHYDPFAGNLSYARIYCGEMAPSQDVYNATKEATDRPSHIYFPMGGTKNGVECKKATTGDLVALTKLKNTSTGDTLCDKSEPFCLPPFEEPEALLNFGIAAKSSKEEDKVSQAIQKMREEDPSLRFERDPQTKEMLLGGLGQAHIDYVVNTLKRQGLEVVLKEPKVPYKETIRAPIRNIEGKHKKQTGGSGQFGVCYIHIEPLPRGSGIEFENQIVGGAIPRQYIPSVEKGIRDALKRGPLTGHEVVDVKITLYDGKYHSVDSSDIAFQTAGRKAIKAAFTDKQAKPVILEPYMRLDVQCPADMVGDVMGDLNGRRGRVLNMETEGKRGKISASVPMAEVLK
ncbi:MAG: elongation factor G, partial [Deltaproteobacteria bacterium]